MRIYTEVKLVGKFAMMAVCALTAGNVSAQNLHAAYFLEGYSYQHEMNPAFAAERNYIALPMLGNVNIGMQSNVGVDNFIYKTPAGSPYKLTTFLHPMIDSGSFLGGLNEKNRVHESLKMSILSTGFRAWGGFNTIGLNVRQEFNTNLPYELFDFLKSGMKAPEGTHYQLKNLKANANSFVELALGHSRAVNDRLTLGGKLKFLFGVGDVTADVQRMDIYMAQDKWTATLDAKLNTSLKGGSYKVKDSSLDDGSPKPTVRHDEFDGIDYDSPALSGLGLGLDLGATYDMQDVLPGLKLSAAVLDLGFIRWNNNLQAANDGTKAFSFDGFDNVAIDSDGENKELGDQMDDLRDDLKAMTKLYSQGDQGGATRMLAATVNVGAEYQMPFYKRLSAGLLSSTHLNGSYTWTEVRLSANVNPVDWFDASVSVAQSTFGTELGGVLNFHPYGINFFIGTNHLFTQVTKQFIPISGSANVCLGFNVTFGMK